MNTQKRILMVVANQFGYHIDAFYYCLYKPDDFDITYIDKSRGLAPISLDTIRIITIPFFQGFWGRYYSVFLFNLKAIIQIWFGNYDLVFVKYYKFCSLLRLFAFWKTFILDIRSGSVIHDESKRLREDHLITYESLFFKNISIISDGLSNKLRIPEKKRYLLPLGARPIQDIPSRSFDSLRLLYVGTFFERKIDLTIVGLHLFMERHPDISVQYTIIGNGKGEERLQAMISDPFFNGCVQLLGYIPHEQLKEYWLKSNVGVSFVPITDQFDVQPPTKTFEYIAAGMPCIATNTQQNALVVNETNGVLCSDSAESFCEALERIWACRKEYDADKITASLGKYNWEEICNGLYEFMRTVSNRSN